MLLISWSKIKHLNEGNCTAIFLFNKLTHCFSTKQWVNCNEHFVVFRKDLVGKEGGAGVLSPWLRPKATLCTILYPTVVVYQRYNEPCCI
jgi:hypothetical protein